MSQDLCLLHTHRIPLDVTLRLTSLFSLRHLQDLTRIHITCTTCLSDFLRTSSSNKCIGEWRYCRAVMNSDIFGSLAGPVINFAAIVHYSFFPHGRKTSEIRISRVQWHFCNSDVDRRASTAKTLNILCVPEKASRTVNGNLFLEWDVQGLKSCMPKILSGNVHKIRES